VKRSKRMQVLDNRPVNKDGFIDEWPEKGFVAMLSPYDPSPSISIEDGKVVEMDGKKREDFDFMDHFIADHYIDVTVAKESMEIPTIDIARMLVDINVPREEIIKLAKGFTPAKLTRVMSHLNVVEMMMAMQKMRSRKHPANQAHITNAKDNPVLIAADAAEGALRGFREEETTVGIARYAPFNAIGLLVGSQIGARGVLTQCSVEEAVELQLGMRGFTTYAETISVYGTEKVFIDGDDTPYSKAFLASAYASRGLKMRYTSGTGSEVLMGNAEKKSMLYLETRCLMVTKGAGVQGIQNGSVSCVGITASVPSGVRAILAENLIAAILDLEVASSNDQTFSHSDIRRTARMLMQMLPGTDFIFSGYSGVPNKDNMIRSGAIGFPIVVRMVQNHHTMNWEKYRQLISETSPLIDCGVHYIDVVQWFTGARINKVQAIGLRTEKDIPKDKYNYGLMTMQLEDGSIGYYEAGWSNTMSSDNLKEFVGPKGRIRLVFEKDRTSHSEEGDLLEYYRYPEKTYEIINIKCERKPTDLQFDYLIDMIEKGHEATPTIDEVYNSFELAFKADACIKSQNSCHSVQKINKVTVKEMAI
jgi:hypothetical protein